MNESQNPKLKHTESGVVIEIKQSPFSIGRGLSCGYVIPSEVISRLHCILENVENKWILKNKSRNGIYHNGCAVKTDALLNNKDTISLCPDGQNYIFLLAQTSTNQPASPDGSTAAVENIKPPPANLLQSFLSGDADLEAVLSEFSSPFPVATSSNSNLISTNISIEVQDINANINSSSAGKLPYRNESPLAKRIKVTPVQSNEVLFKEEDFEDQQVLKLQEPEFVSNIKESENLTCNKDDKVKSQDKVEEMEDEMQCSICSEMFVKATTLNCSHTFCKYCIETWKKNRNLCPICRTRITSLNATLVLDNVIEKVIQNASDEVKNHRKELIDERKKIEEKNTRVPSNNNRGRGGNRGGRAIRGNYTNRGRTNNGRNNFVTAPMNAVIELDTSSESDSSSTSSTSSSNSSDLDDDLENQEWEPGIPGAYYGGYGHCYSCGSRGHWANGCPFN